MNELFTQHIYTGKAWVHIVSPAPVTADIRERLLYANSLLSAQYAVRVPKFIQVIDEAHEALETEFAVGLVRYPDLEFMSEAFLVSDEIYMEFSKFHSDPEAYKGLDAVLQWHHRHWGLICALVGMKEDEYEHLESKESVSGVESDRTEGGDEGDTAESDHSDEHGT